MFDAKKISSAHFWLVFGEGMSISDANLRMESAGFADIEEWSDNEKLSWKNFERVIDGDDEYLNRVSWVPSKWDRFVWKIQKLFPWRFKIVNVNTKE